MYFSSSSLLTLSLTLAFGQAHPSHSGSWGNFKNLVTFGDSYTDENRLGYFINNNGSAPPVGWVQPVGLATSTGGRTWPRYVSQYTGANLYNYAVSGAVCSNKVTPRWFGSINAPFPDILGYELPAWIADSKYKSATGAKFYSGNSKDTVYAIWIGTNDLGNNAFLTDSQVPGKTLKDYVDCVYSTVDGLYKNGGRYFVLMNLAPLQLLPQYAVPSDGGLKATQYYPDKDPNTTSISWRMYENVVTVNEIYKYRTPFAVAVAEEWDGIKIANYDVNALMTDIHSNPKNYLNGTAPLNVTGVINSCDVSGKTCVKVGSPDSYLWYDALHPSEQADRIVAREFVGVMNGKSKWATYWG